MLKVTLDYETRSKVDIKKVGAYNYARHPSTRVLCLAYKLEDEPTRVWRAWAGEVFPKRMMEFFRRDYRLCAHNALFEQVVTRFVLPRHLNPSYALHLPKLPTSRWQCTAAKAASYGLPRNLEGVGAALKLPIQKDLPGHRLMLKWSKPRKPTKNDAREWFDDPEEYERLVQYCITDVEAEHLVDKSLPDMPEAERKIWLLDQKINLRGVHVDVPLVKNALDLIEQETKKLNAETLEITDGEINSATKRAQVLNFVNSGGACLDNLQAKTVRDFLKSKEARLIPDECKRLLEIRQAISKTSTKKYQAFLERAGHDSRVRDLLLYHGASTGRWSGMGIQPQNLPSGKVKELDLAFEVLADGDLERMRLLWGDPMEVLSSCIRGMMVASPGHELFCADFNAIEARVLFWIANHKAGLDAFRTGADLYVQMAAVIFDKPASEVTKAERDLGKRAVLGCGYEMGWRKFGETCAAFGQPISEELAKASVEAYRSLHAPVVRVWRNLEKAAILAVQTKKAYRVHKTRWYTQGKFLFCELPSGRRLAYYGPRVENKRTPWGEMRPALKCFGVDSMTKKWVEWQPYGGLLTENVVQAISRDFMAASMVRTEEAGYKTLITVHDEDLAERKKGEGSLEEFEGLMGQKPAWGIDCPLKVAGWVGARYRK